MIRLPANRIQALEEEVNILQNNEAREQQMPDMRKEIAAGSPVFGKRRSLMAVYTGFASQRRMQTRSPAGL